MHTLPNKSKARRRASKAARQAIWLKNSIRYVDDTPAVDLLPPLESLAEDVTSEVRESKRVWKTIRTSFGVVHVVGDAEIDEAYFSKLQCPFAKDKK